MIIFSNRTFTCLLCKILFFFPTLHGQDIHVKYTEEEIVIDGQENEKEWAQANSSGQEFWQFLPTDSIKALQQTELKVLYDENNLYFLIKAFSESKNYLVSTLKRDPKAFGQDGFNILLDTYSDATNAYAFGSNPLAIEEDFLISNGGTNWEKDLDFNWDVKWKVESKIYDGYYISEIKIPLNSIRFPKNSKSWKINILRFNSQNGEYTTWSKIPQNKSTFDLSFMKKMTFENPLEEIRYPISIIPFTNILSSRDFENNQKTNNFDIGGDAKISISSGLNLDLTINPDFSQVEVDDEIINLTRFEVSLPEKRQFFIDNSDLFSNYGDAYEARPFFSRRIGVANDKDGNTIENKILAGVRLSGKINNTTRIGFLNMLTDEDIRNEIPSNNNTVLTFQKNVFSRSSINFFLINREAIKNYTFLSNDEKYNRVFGLEYKLASKDNTWIGTYFVNRSFTPNSGKDSDAAGASLNYNSRNHEFRLKTIYLEEDYNSDLGYIKRTGILKHKPSYTYKIYPKTEKIINVEFEQSAYLTYAANQNNINSDRHFKSEVKFFFENLSRLELTFNNRYTYLFNAFDPTRSDDGTPLPGVKGYTYSNFEINYDGNPRNQLNFSAKSDVGNFYNGKKSSIKTTINWRLQPYFKTSLLLSYNYINLPDPYSKAKLWLIGPKMEFTFNKSVTWSSFFQYNSQSDNFIINSRLQWRFAPLSDLYVVYNDNYLTVDGLSPKVRSFNIKLIYWLNM